MAGNLSLEAGREQVERAARASRGWIITLARFGYVAKGAVYLVIALLAAMAAFSLGGEMTGTNGAIETIFRQPFGQILLGLLAIGLVGHAIWRFVQAAFNPERKGIGSRLAYVGIGIIYIGLAFSAVGLLAGWGSSANADEKAPKEWTATLMEQPFGEFLVAAIGIGFLIYAAVQFYYAYSTKFRKEIKTDEMSDKAETFAIRAAQIGISARAVVFIIIGLFLIVAAWQNDPNQVRGLGGALRALAQQPFGAYLLGLVALGLVAYSVFLFVEARYRRIEF